MAALSQTAKTARIRELNDAFRRSFTGRIFATDGVAALPEAVRNEAFVRVIAFNDFSENNDPHGEHDFGSFELCGRKFFWKIDYYDPDLKYGSEDPSDPSQTTRVLTLMLASEY